MYNNVVSGGSIASASASASAISKKSCGVSFWIDLADAVVFLLLDGNFRLVRNWENILLLKSCPLYRADIQLNRNDTKYKTTIFGKINAADAMV